MITWPKNIIEDVARRRCVLFLGAGVSKNAASDTNNRPPDWIEFLRTGIERCPRPVKHIQTLIKNNDLLTACEIIREKLDDDWERLLTDSFTTPRYSPGNLHTHIFNLDARLVLTQNFDKIYDTFAQHESNNTISIKNYYDSDTAAVLRGDKRAVIKIHGTIDEPSRMVFTRKDYAEARYKHAAFHACIDALAITHTMIFIGCSLFDPDIQMFLERYAQHYPTGRPHFIIMPRGKMHSDEVMSVKRNLNLKIINYNPKNNHKELAESVELLSRSVENKRAELADSQDW